jgi:NifU-like protein involved in Fe-S cluster formation
MKIKMADQLPYSEKVMDHFTNPRNVGEIPDASGVGTVGNAICGDVMKMFLKIENDIIVDVKFKTFGCLPPKERIVSSKGGWVEISQVKKGTKVVNSEGKETQAVELYNRNYNGKMFTINPFVSPFNSFRVTAEHPIYCLKRENIQGARRYGPKCDWLRVREENLFATVPDFVKASDLAKGDYLVFNVNKEVRDDCLFTNEVMRLLGYYLSEGYIIAQGGAVAFAFNKKEKKLINELKNILKKFVGKEPNSRIRDNVEEVYICSRKLVRFLMLHCGKLARNKSLSEDILLLPFSKQWELIQTYLSGDGDMYRRRPKNSKTYRFTTVSESIAIQMQEMLARGGIFASIRKIMKTNCYIDNRKLKDSVQYLVSFKLVRANKFVHYNNKYFFVPIRSIEIKNFKGKVYNFQVCEKPNTYLAKGFVVHNCGAAVATSSMVTEMVKGKSIEEALKISNKAVAEALGGLPPVKMHCSVLAEEALRSALADYYKKQGKPVPFEEKPHGGHEH